MPIPKPRKNEKQDEFMSRCMADDAMVKEYKDTGQRFAICKTSWDNRNKVNMADVEALLNNDYVELDGVEILNTYPNSHGIKFEKKDLIEIRNNYEMLKEQGQLVPIVKVSHSDQQALLKKLFGVDDVDSYEELPLLGVIEDLKISDDGKSLKAKIGRIPAMLKDVFGKMFKAVSPEIIFNWRGTGQKVLRAIALTNMPSQKHITDVAMSEGLVCDDIIIIQDEVTTMQENAKPINEETLVEKLAEKIGGLFKKDDKQETVVLSASEFEGIKAEINELKKKLIEKEEAQKNFSAYLEKVKREAIEEKANAICDKALNDGVPKVVIDKLKPLLLSDIGEHTIKMSQEVDGQPMEISISVFDVVKDLFENYPAGKVDFSDKTVTELSAPSDDQSKLVRMKAEEYMKQGLSEFDALMKAGREILK